MKPTALSVLLSFSAFFLTAQSYNYIPFPDSNITWTGFRKFCTSPGCPPNYQPWTYRIEGDTMIDNLIYHRLSSTDYVREDSNKRVFLGRADDSLFVERMLFDFSLSVGDTMIWPRSYTWIVRSIDTPLYNSIPRRTLHVYAPNNGPSDNWIEGIGSSASPIGRYSYAGGVDSYLCEAYQDSLLIYYLDPGCSAFNDIDEKAAEKSLTISPNPADKQIVIKASSMPALAVYNLMGAILFEIEANKQSEVLIDASDLPAGVYLVRALFSNGEIGTRRVLVQH